MSSTMTAPFFATQHLLRATAAGNALSNGLEAQSKFSRPLRQRLRPSFKRKMSVVALVVCLLYASGPFAVAWFVSPLVISALDLQASPISPFHISPEILETQPFLADCDSPAPVVLEHLVLGIKASSFHAAPSPIWTTSRHPMNSASAGCVLSVEASTAFSGFIFELCSPNYPLLSAIASAVPHYPNVYVRGAVENKDSGKSLTHEILGSRWHNAPLPMDTVLARRII